MFLWGVHLSVLNCPVTAFFTDYVVALKPVLMEPFFIVCELLIIICAAVGVILVVAILIQDGGLSSAMEKYEDTFFRWIKGKRSRR